MPRGKKKHMDINDRIAIQRGLEEGRSLSSIAREIGVAASTVCREVRANRTMDYRGKRIWNPCSKKRGCTVRNVCGGCELARCASCRRVRCWEACGQYEENRCDVIERAPYICGDCHRFANCGFVRASYSAVEAQLSYEKRLVETREGISITPAQLESLVELVRTRLRQGWSIEAIWAVHGDRLPVSARTMYKYVEAGLLGLANIDLPRKVRYKPRRAVSGSRPIDRDGRSYSDFLDLPLKTRQRAVQMDTVIGRRGDFKCILTLHFPAIEFQVMILLDDHDCEAVVGALDWIEAILGTAEFARLFGTILTDRGIEFCDFEAIERSCLSNAFALQGVLLRPAALGPEGELREEPRGAPQDPAQGIELRGPRGLRRGERLHPRQQLPEEKPGRQDAVFACRQARSSSPARRARDLQAQGRRGHPETESAFERARLSLQAF